MALSEATRGAVDSTEVLEQLVKLTKRSWIVLFCLPPSPVDDGIVRLGISFGQSVLCAWSEESGRRTLVAEVSADVVGLLPEYPWKLYTDDVHYFSKNMRDLLWVKVTDAVVKAIDGELHRNGFVVARPCSAFREMSREEQQAKQIEFVEDFRILEGRSVEEILVRGDLNGKED